MPAFPLSPEICGRIVRLLSGNNSSSGSVGRGQNSHTGHGITQLVPTRQFSLTGNLAILCRTCRAFQKPAEARLYESLFFLNSEAAFLACRTLNGDNGKRLALLVKSFWLSQQSQYEARRPNQRDGKIVQLPREFWLAIQGALSRMHNLETLVLFDATFTNSWVLLPPAAAVTANNESNQTSSQSHFEFRLRDAKLRFTWDANIVRFLQSQKHLRRLHTLDRVLDVNRLSFEKGGLPLLQSLDGMAMVVLQILGSYETTEPASNNSAPGSESRAPLVHLQMMIDHETAMAANIAVTNKIKKETPDHQHTPTVNPFLSQLPRLGIVRSTLRALSFLDLPEDHVIDALNIVSRVCPNIVYLGVIPLPVVDRHHLHLILMHMPKLEIIQLDVYSWVPHPNIPAQRALATELRMYCPSLKQIVFWIGSTRVWWYQQQLLQQQRAGQGQKPKQRQRHGHLSQDEIGIVTDEEWVSQIDLHQHPQLDQTWMSV